MAFKVHVKRRRSSSVVRPVVGYSDIARSPPNPHTRLVKDPHLQPETRVSLLSQRSVDSSVAGSTQAGNVTSRLQLRKIAPSDVSLRPELDEDILEREDNDFLNEIVMAVDLRDRGTVGCCYYIAREEKLCMIEDVKSGGIEVIDSRKYHRMRIISFANS